MEIKINYFFKTEHFMHRQWERGLSDKILENILPQVNRCNHKLIIIVSRVYLKQISNKKSLDLFIILNGKSLITCDYCNFQDFLLTAKRAHYQIISQG